MVLVSAAILVYCLKIKKMDGSTLYVNRKLAAAQEDARTAEETPDGE